MTDDMLNNSYEVLGGYDQDLRSNGLGVAGFFLQYPLCERRKKEAGAYVIVAEQPNPRWWERADERERREQILLGPSFERLTQFADMRYPRDYLLRFDRVNVQREPGRWNSKAAVERARYIVRYAYKRPIILCGRRVIDAFFPDKKVLFLTDLVIEVGKKGFNEEPARSHCLCLPHPSGRNRWWNEASNKTQVGPMLRSFLRPER